MEAVELKSNSLSEVLEPIENDTKELKKRGRPRVKTSEKILKKPGRPRKNLLKVPEVDNEILPKKSYRRRNQLDDQRIFEAVNMNCDRCGAELESFTDALNHHRDAHNQKGYLLCCARKFKQRSALVDHLDFHTNPEYFKCRVCEKNFTSLSNLRTHITLSHIPQTKYSCDQCGKFINCKYRLAAHLKTHRIRPPKVEAYPCLELKCGKSFHTRTGLMSHQKICHNPNRETFPCEICGKQLRTRTSLKEHIK